MSLSLHSGMAFTHERANAGGSHYSGYEYSQKHHRGCGSVGHFLKLYLRVSEMRKPVRRPPWSKWHFAGHRVIPQCRVLRSWRFPEDHLWIANLDRRKCAINRMHFNGWLCGAVLAIKGPDTNLHFTFCRAANSRLVRKMQNVLLAFGSAMLIFGLRKSNGQVSGTEDTSGCREKWFPEIEVSARLSLC